jgi:Cys-rich repeat protein
VACTDDVHCGDGACDLQSNTCVECRFDDQCPEGDILTPQEYCNPDTQSCQLCVEDSHCPDGLVCDTDGVGDCVECLDNADCSGNGGRCVASSVGDICGQCTTDADCSGGQRCHPTTQFCVPAAKICNADADCGANFICDEEYRLCVRTNNANCTNDGDCLPEHQCRSTLAGQRCIGCDILFSPCPQGQTCIPFFGFCDLN